MFTMNDTNTILAKLLIQRTCKARRERRVRLELNILSLQVSIFANISQIFNQLYSVQL